MDLQGALDSCRLQLRSFQDTFEVSWNLALRILALNVKTDRWYDNFQHPTYLSGRHPQSLRRKFRVHH
jgi:hypothetical protein